MCWWTHPLVISPGLGCIVVTHILNSCQNIHVDFLTCGVRANMLGIANWKPLELPIPRKTINQMQYHILGGAIEISVTIK